ncbi:MAG: disulfide bond formation protein B [Gammaproteobacteria bacterium]|nr:disulfide bond formation protein B [Gammaproteobacteria bacterium]
MTIPSPRIINILIFLGCAGLMAVALFFEHVVGLEPCYLCIMQRLMVISTGTLALLAALHNPAALGIKIYAVLLTLSALGGGLVSIRQLWLQSLPADQVPACGPGIDYLLDVFPIVEVLEMLLKGDGSCAEVLWSLFGISMPGWVLFAFAGLMAISLFQVFRSA